jgi:hypothetical protein
MSRALESPLLQACSWFGMVSIVTAEPMGGQSLEEPGNDGRLHKKEE